MKITSSIFSFSTGILLLTACSKAPEPTPSASQTPAPPTPAAIETAQKSAQSTAAEVKATANTVTTEAAKAAETVVKAPEVVTPPPPLVATPAPAPVPATQAAVQPILERARALVAEQKYPEAVAALSELSSIKLTAEQQNIVNQLKAQITNAMAAKAANDGLKSVGGAVPKQ